jgi:hypothetical protein
VMMVMTVIINNGKDGGSSWWHTVLACIDECISTIYIYITKTW